MNGFNTNSLINLSNKRTFFDDFFYEEKDGLRLEHMMDDPIPVNSSDCYHGADPCLIDPEDSIWDEMCDMIGILPTKDEDEEATAAGDPTGLFSSPSALISGHSRKRNISDDQEELSMDTGEKVPLSLPSPKKQKISMFQPPPTTKTIECEISDDLTPVFSNFHTKRWDELFNELVEYKKVQGHAHVPNQWSGNKRLAQWVKRQRYQYRLKTQGKFNTMTKERETALESLGFIWDLHDAIWEERLNELRAFKQKFGHAKVPLSYPENPELAIWAKCQRRHFMSYCDYQAKGKEWNSNSMSLERILKLAKVGFVFSNRSSHEALDALQIYARTSGPI